jgi:hypothetical protein
MPVSNLFSVANIVLSTAFITVASMAGASDATLTAPTGDVVLTVSGAVSNSNVDGTAQFDMDMLEAMPATEFTTETIWTEGQQTFRGVSLHDFLETVGATGNALSAQAINDYAVTVPISDAVEGGPIIAYELNGSPMSRRDKGPLWIVYPYDSSADYRTEVIYSRSIWQLDRITVE